MINNIKSRMPYPVKYLGRKIINRRDRIISEYWGKVAAENPQKSVEREVERQKQNTIRKVDIANPKYFSEKLYWLKYYLYNPSPVVAQCYNKYEVRQYVESKGLAHILNEQYGVWTSIDDITWDELPDEYVMKISNGYDGHVFKRKNESFSVKNAKKILSNSLSKYSYYYKLTGDLFVGNTRQYIICEKLLHSNLGFTSPEDYKFYCFHGEPKYIEFMANRESGSKYEEVFVDMELKDRHELEGDSRIGTFEKPSCFDEMVKIAKTLSEDFPFVRVDLYVENERPVFGELTFTPFHNQTVQSEVELSQLLDLSNIDVYKEKLL